MAKHPCYIITKRKNGQHQFNLTASNGQTILTSQGYADKGGCMNGIESVRDHAEDDSNYDRKEAADGSPYFVLKASNQQVIGKSEMYSSKSARDNGIESVKVNGPIAALSDET